jgi:hypothetical protein
VAADERSGPASRLTPTAGSDKIAGSETQTASFAVGALRLELSAAPGAARLVVTDGESRDIYVVDPAALASWSAGTLRLLALTPAGRWADATEYRAPFLIDREGRASIAFEAHVTNVTVTYRLLVSGASSRVAGIMTSADLVRGIADAAAGAVALARSVSS